MILKFLFDRIIAFIGILLIWPFIIIVIIIIKLKMPDGPAIFKQIRVGKDGKLFICHKFRTMSENCNKSTISVKNDNRITPLGAILRYYKIDELPGLWDVMIGNMSFVGPRPDVPGYADKLQGEDRIILNLRPGITGPATLKYRQEDQIISSYVIEMQTNGDNRAIFEIAEEFNNKILYPDKVRINIYYYKHYSFLKDIQIILCTILNKRMEYNGELI